jgi:hypothetical protein
VTSGSFKARGKDQCRHSDHANERANTKAAVGGYSTKADRFALSAESTDVVSDNRLWLARVPRYLNRLYERLNARTFPPEDRLYWATFKAQAALGELAMALHYVTCDGVGEPGRER